MDPLEHKLQLAEVAGTWTAAIAVIIGGLFGVFQYLEHKAAVRVDRTMALVERYHSDGLLMNARLQISESMTLHVDEINRLLTNPDIEPDELAKYYSESIIQIVIDDALSGPLEQVFTFYEQIILCRDLNLCDGPVAEQFFDIDARSYVRTYYPYICSIRAKWNNPEKFALVVNFYTNNSEEICSL